MAHGRILETRVKSFNGHWGSRVSGKRKNWARKETFAQRLRENVRSLVSRPFTRNKAF